jgi:hypothetical protein
VFHIFLSPSVSSKSSSAPTTIFFIDAKCYTIGSQDSYDEYRLMVVGISRERIRKEKRQDSNKKKWNNTGRKIDGCIINVLFFLSINSVQQITSALKGTILVDV